MDVTVFYAWQEDRPKKLNRYLIRDAAKAACKRITDDSTNEFAVSLDEATLGTPGMCDIPNTILEKVREWDFGFGCFGGSLWCEVAADNRTRLIAPAVYVLELANRNGVEALVATRDNYGGFNE